MGSRNFNLWKDTEPLKFETREVFAVIYAETLWTNCLEMDLRKFQLQNRRFTKCRETVYPEHGIHKIRSLILMWDTRDEIFTFSEFWTHEFSDAWIHRLIEFSNLIRANTESGKVSFLLLLLVYREDLLIGIANDQ